MMPFSIADILRCTQTDEYLMLINKRDEEYNGHLEVVWEMIDIVSGHKFWEWESIIEDVYEYERIA